MATKKDKLLCPNGHTLPHTVANGAQCTPVVCAVENIGHGLQKQKQERTDEAAEVAVAMEKANRQVGIKVAQEKLRKKLIPRPVFEDTKSAEEWAQMRLIQLAPDAVAELEYQLQYGDDSQRAAAARDVLDANGMRRREAMQGGGQTIILHMGGSLPWAANQTVTIDATKQPGKASASQAQTVQQYVREGLRRLPEIDSGGPHQGPDEAALEPDASPVHQGPDEG